MLFDNDNDNRNNNNQRQERQRDIHIRDPTPTTATTSLIMEANDPMVQDDMEDDVQPCPQSQQQQQRQQPPQWHSSHGSSQSRCASFNNQGVHYLVSGSFMEAIHCFRSSLEEIQKTVHVTAQDADDSANASTSTAPAPSSPTAPHSPCKQSCCDAAPQQHQHSSADAAMMVSPSLASPLASPRRNLSDPTRANAETDALSTLSELFNCIRGDEEQQHCQHQHQHQSPHHGKHPNSERLNLQQLRMKFNDPNASIFHAQPIRMITSDTNLMSTLVAREKPLRLAIAIYNLALVHHTMCLLCRHAQDVLALMNRTRDLYDQIFRIVDELTVPHESCFVFEWIQVCTWNNLTHLGQIRKRLGGRAQAVSIQFLQLVLRLHCRQYDDDRQAEYVREQTNTFLLNVFLQDIVEPTTAVAA